MPLKKAVQLIKSFADKKPVSVAEVTQKSPSDWEVLRVSKDLFQNAMLLADMLSFPVQISYVSDKGGSRMLDVVIREIRKHDANSYFLRVEHEKNGNEHLLSSDRIEELYVGELGMRYLSDNDAVPNHEDWMFDLADKIFGKVERKRIAPHVNEFMHLFEPFAGGKCRNTRIKLHVMSYLSRLDKRYCDKERVAMRGFIESEKEVAPQQRDALTFYAANSLITSSAFAEAIAHLDELPVEEVQHLMQHTRVLIEADGNATPEEAQFYDQVMRELKA